MLFLDMTKDINQKHKLICLWKVKDCVVFISAICHVFALHLLDTLSDPTVTMLDHVLMLVDESRVDA